MSINTGTINGAAINAAAGPPPVPVVQVPLNMANAINSPPLPVVQVPLNLANAIPPTTSAPFTWSLPLKVDQANTWDLPLAVAGIFQFPQGTFVQAPFEFPLGLMGKANVPFEFPLPIKDTDPVNAPFEFPLLMKVDNPFVFPVPLMEKVNAPLTFPLPLSTTPTAPLTYPLPILSVNPVKVPFSFLLPLLTEDAINVTGILTITLVKTGEKIEILQGNLEFAEGDYNWSGSVVIARLADFQKFALDDEVTLTLAGEDFNMIVDETSLDRGGPAELRSRLQLIGKAALFDTPRVEPITVEFNTPISAHAAAEQILGTTIDWQLIDWLIPAGRLGATSASPVQVVQKIAEAGGGLLETNPDGTFFVRDRYPVSVPNMPSATPDQQIFEATDLFQQQETLQNQEIENRLRIRDVGDGGTRDRMQFVADEANGRQGTIKVWPSPWRQITLEHTSDAAITVVDTGVQEFSETDQIEIEDGSGNASDPIFAIDSETWMDDDLGPLTFEQDATEVQASNPGVDGYGLVTIEYRTRAFTWFVSSPVDDDVQFIVRDC